MQEKFEDGMAIVKQNGKYGVINNNFNIVIDCQYNNLKKRLVIIYMPPVMVMVLIGV